MSVLIGHASIDERGKAYGGVAGDQTGKEVYIRSWYNSNWNVMLRPISITVAENMAAFCEAICKSNRVGYDQWQRNSLRTVCQNVNWDPSKITNCETDCSAFMTVCAEAAGVNVSGCYSYGNAPVTQNMRKLFQQTGSFQVFTDPKYLKADTYLKRGDILVRESGHTCMVLSNGSGVTNTTTGSKSKQTITEVATDVLRGIYGNGTDRALKIEEAGYDYKTVQREVNHIVLGMKTIDDVAKEVIDGKWGLGSEREDKLVKEGYDAKAVQGRVNELLKGMIQNDISI